MSGDNAMSWKTARRLVPTASSPSLRHNGNLEGADPELCISLLERGLNFSGLKHRLREADQRWMEEFLADGGLAAIFDALDALGKKGFSSIADALRQLECVGCIKAVMNNRFGLEFIICAPGESFVRKLMPGERIKDACPPIGEGYRIARTRGARNA